jgi:hypothetical protein
MPPLASFFNSFEEQVVDGSANPARGEAAAAERFVDGGDAADFEEAGLLVVEVVGEDFELRLDHFEVARRAARLDLAVERDHLSGLEFVFEIRAVKPHRFERGQVLADGHLEDRHRAGAEQGGAADFADDAGHLAGL